MIFLFLAALVIGAFLSARTVMAFVRAGHRQRCVVDEVAICSEADRAERGLYARWVL